MTIEFACPYCGQKFEVETARAGETGPCAACGEPITVPNPNKVSELPMKAMELVCSRYSSDRFRFVISE